MRQAGKDFFLAHFTHLETNAKLRVSDITKISKRQNKDFELNSFDLCFAILIKYIKTGLS